MLQRPRSFPGRALVSRKNQADQGMNDLNLSETPKLFWSHSTGCSLEKQPQKCKLFSFFTYEGRFGGYFKWNVHTHFQRMCT